MATSRGFWEKIDCEIKFNPEWVIDETDEKIKFSQTVRKVKLKDRETAKCKTPMGGKIFFIGTLDGTMILYQPPNKDQWYKRVDGHEASIIDIFLDSKPNGWLTRNDEKNIFDGEYFNVGNSVELFYKQVLIDVFFNGTKLNMNEIISLHNSSSVEKLLEMTKKTL